MTVEGYMTINDTTISFNLLLDIANINTEVDQLHQVLMNSGRMIKSKKCSWDSWIFYKKQLNQKLSRRRI